jgi:hypothetical protein
MKIQTSLEAFRPSGMKIRHSVHAFTPSTVPNKPSKMKIQTVHALRPSNTHKDPPTFWQCIFLSILLCILAQDASDLVKCKIPPTSQQSTGPHEFVSILHFLKWVKGLHLDPSWILSSSTHPSGIFTSTLNPGRV